MPPLADDDKDDYEDGEEDNGKGGTPEERATILHCIFWDFYCLPPSIGWRCPCSAGGAMHSRGDATAGSNEEDNNNDDQGEDKEEVD